MPIISLNDITGGIRRLPPRIAPQNSLKNVLNVVPNINGNVFETCGLNNIFMYSFGALCSEVLEAIACSIDGVGTIFYFGNEGSTYRIFQHTIDDNSIVYTPDIDSSLTYPLLLLPSRGNIIFHNAKYNCAEGDVRRLYKNGDFPRFSDLIGGGEGYGFYSMPTPFDNKQLSDSLGLITGGIESGKINILGIIFTETSLTSKNYLPPVIPFTDIGSDVIIKVGVRFDGYQSVARKILPHPYSSGGYSGLYSLPRAINGGTCTDDTCVFKLTLAVHASDAITTFSERLSGLDIYVARAKYNLFAQKYDDSLDWLYVDHIPMDADIDVMSIDNVLLTNGATTIDLSLISPTPVMETNIFANCVLQIRTAGFGTIQEEIPILSNTSTVLFLASAITTGSAYRGLIIKTKWYYSSTYNAYVISRFVSSLSGEGLIYRTGVSDRKVMDIHDYCPPAHFIESFKGRIWMADYYEYGETRQKNRLICSSVNSDGNVCEDIYNVEEYFEFDGNITFLKATDEVLYIGTTVGLYSLRFVPSTNEYSPVWQTSKISELVISDKKRVFAVKDKLFMFNGNTIFVSDGVFVKNILNDELIEIISESFNQTYFDANKYSIAYDSASDSILLFLDNILKLKENVLLYNINYTGRYFVISQLFENKLTFAIDSNVFSVSPVTSGFAVTEFNVEIFDNDLGTKEDKYLNEFVINFYKAAYTDLVIEIYNESQLLKSKILSVPSQYDGKLTIKPLKSIGRRFKTLRYKMYSEGNADVAVRSIDVDFDVIPKTTIPSSLSD